MTVEQNAALLVKVRAAARQEQFLDVVAPAERVGIAAASATTPATPAGAR